MDGVERESENLKCESETSIPLYFSNRLRILVRENKPWCKLGLFGALFEIEDADKDSILFKEGDHGNKFYLIVKGHVDVFVTRNDNFVQIDSLSSNAWFGEMSLVLDTPRYDCMVKYLVFLPAHVVQI